MKECVPKGDNDGRSGRFCRYSTHILPIRDSFHSEKSIIISSNEWRNRNESISYRKIHFLKEKTEKHDSGTVGRKARRFKQNYFKMGNWSFPNKRILETIHETPACVKGITIEYYIF